MATLDQPTPSPVPAGSLARSLVRPFLILVMIGAVVGAGVYVVSTLGGGEGQEISAKTLKYTVAKGDMLVTVMEDGELASASNVEVKCEVAGGSSIIYIVPDGEIVQEGDLVVELDKSTLEDQINQQKIVYGNASASLIQAQQDVTVAEKSIEEYEKGLFVQQQQDADAQIKIALENLRNAENTLSHTERMFRKGYVSQLELETQKFAVERSQLELDSAKTAMSVLVEFTKNKTVSDLLAQVDIAKARAISEEAAFSLEKSKLERLEEQLTKCMMYAPKTGMVVYSNSEGSRFGGSSAVSIEEGAQVRERQSIIKLPDLANMQVNVKVHESKVENLERGMRALIRVQGRELQGTVISVANQPEATSRWEGNVKEYKTIVKVDGEPDGLRPGMTAEVEILVTNLKDVIRVPTSAVVETGIEYHCWIVDGSKTERRQLEVGMTDGEYVEVKSGLEIGEIVVRNPRAIVEEARESADASDDEEEDAGSKFGERKAVDADQGGASAGQGRRGEGRGGEGRGGEGGRGGRGGGAAAGGGGAQGGGGGGSFDMMQFDTDGDSKISKDEAPEYLKSYFDTMDKDGDGFITKEEAEEAVKSFRARMGQ